MGIQINGQTDIISATDGSLTISGAELPTVTNLNATGIVTATGFVGNITGNINATGVSTIATLNVTQSNPTNLNVSGVTTTATLRATSIVGVTTAGITTAYIGSVNDGPLSGLRNRIINGNFDIWQRGTSTSMSASSVYTIDRWVTGGTGTTSRQTFTLGQTEVPGNPKYYAQYNISSNSQNYEFTQKIEGVETFAGEQVTLSFYARRTSGTINIGARLVQYFGTGGSPSGTVVTSVSGGNLSLTTSWQKFVFTASVPSISGKTIGSNNDDSLWVSFQINDTNTGTIQFAQVQLEAGTVATPFERRSFGQELALCQRYCYRFGGDGTGYTQYTRFPVGNWGGTTAVTIQLVHPPMRSTNRTVTGTGAIQIVSSSGGTGSSTPTYSYNTDANNEVTTSLNIGGLSGGTDGNYASVRINNNANAYVLITSEL